MIIIYRTLDYMSITRRLSGFLSHSLNLQTYVRIVIYLELDTYYRLLMRREYFE